MLHPDMRHRMLAELQQQAGEHWMVTNDGPLVTLRIGPESRDCIYLQDGRFTAKRVRARTVLNKAVVVVQQPAGTLNDFSYLSLQTGREIFVLREERVRLQNALRPGNSDVVTSQDGQLLLEKDGQDYATAEGLDALRLIKLRDKRHA